MNQENGGGDAQELELRARIMGLRRTVRGLERRQRTALPMELEPIVVAMFYAVGLEELNRERRELDTAERFYRDTYPNLLERLNLQEENHEVQEHFIDADFLNAVMERARQMQQFGEQLLRELHEVAFNPVEVPPNPPVPPLENGRIPPPAIRDFPVAEAQGNPDIAPQQRGAQEFMEWFLEEMNAAPENLIQVIRVDPRQEAQEDPENRNPEEPRQEEGHENQPDIQEELLNPIEVARAGRYLNHAQLPRLHRPPPAIRQFPAAGAQRNPDIAPRRLGDQEFIEQWNAARRFFEHRQNQNEPRQEDQEGPENQREPDNQPQN
ncbi:hypothetical protein L3Y34_019241 [Caenorhabditis briggsae]|uniref:Uncharacterized protein n=1 Tax=Caenorhabditis briggsae TaxID=6238 RepID=A0AAE9DNI7_CAEBR|nr:hypothetical protein L3Y34_019241 [Caenorhabditis briggsae]